MFLGAVGEAGLAFDGDVRAVAGEAEFLVRLAFFGGSYPPEFSLLLVCELSITVALELRASERVSCKGFPGSGLVPPAPPRLPYRQVSALIK